MDIEIWNDIELRFEKRGNIDESWKVNEKLHGSYKNEQRINNWIYNVLFWQDTRGTLLRFFIVGMELSWK